MHRKQAFKEGLHDSSEVNCLETLKKIVNKMMWNIFTEADFRLLDQHGTVETSEIDAE
jgi:hypothetical protein